MIIELSKWDRRFLELAKFVSQWSKDPSTKVGAVIAYNKRIISVGYNGFAQHTDDSPERYNNREEKYRRIVHAECNAMHFAERSIAGFTLYTYPFMPCSVCAGHIIQRGIARVVCPRNNNERWQESFRLTRLDLSEAGVELYEVEFE